MSKVSDMSFDDQRAWLRARIDERYNLPPCPFCGGRLIVESNHSRAQRFRPRCRERGHFSSMSFMLNSGRDVAHWLRERYGEGDEG